MNFKTLTMTGLATFSFFLATAQNSNLKTEKSSFLGNDFTFKVNEDKIKSGTFSLIDQKTKNLIAKGNYLDGSPNGNWYFYNQKPELESCYNYDQKKLLFVDTTLLAQNVVTIKSSDKNISENASAPVLLYPKELFIKAITNSFFQSVSTDSTDLHLEIRTNLAQDKLPVYTLLYYQGGLQKSMNIDLKNLQFPIDWIPSKYNNEIIPAEIKMKVVLTGLQLQDERARRTRWDN